MENIKILCDRQDIVFIADAVRNKTGSSQELTLGDIAASIDGIETGAGLPTLTNEGTAADLLSGKQLIDSDGNIVEGTIATKTASNLTASGATVTVPAGYYASQTTKSVATATQATPSITINASGLITATATQAAGYVVAGSKSATKQLAFQAAKTITPTTTSQTAVSSGYYTGGNITVKGDANLVAGNIKSGVSIFGVSGTYAGSGANTSFEDGLITRQITSCINDRVTYIGSNAFLSCSKLTYVSFANVISIYSAAFKSCAKLTSAYFPKATTIAIEAFYNASSLNYVSLPAVTNLNNSAFVYCRALQSISLPKISTINMYAFSACYKLTKIYLMNSSICKLPYSNAFMSTPIGGYSKSAGTYGSIYVPASLLTSYKTATNWTYFSSRFIGI